MTTRERAVVVVADALREFIGSGHAAESADDYAEVALDALLASRVPTPCETCSGTQRVLREAPSTMTDPCPDCEPPRPLVVLYDSMEQVGIQPARTTALCHTDHYVGPGRALYAFRHKESEAP